MTGRQHSPASSQSHSPALLLSAHRAGETGYQHIVWHDQLGDRAGSARGQAAIEVGADGDVGRLIESVPDEADLGALIPGRDDLPGQFPDPAGCRGLQVDREAAGDLAPDLTWQQPDELGDLVVMSAEHEG